MVVITTAPKRPDKEFQHMNLISSLERDIVVDGVLKYH